MPLEESWGDESWYSLQQTFALRHPMTFEEVVVTVAAIARDYPFFTWDEAGEIHVKIIANHAENPLIDLHFDFHHAPRLSHDLPRASHSLIPCAQAAHTSV